MSSAMAQVGNFSWNSIAPASTLDFVPCYQNFSCARLEVPLDWSANASDNETAILAIIKLTTEVDHSDKRYGGSIIINPGGPGNSGVQDLLDRGKQIQSIVESSDKAEEQYFDIISFDPRGVGITLPPLSCFPDLLSSYLWSEALQAEGLVNSSEHAEGYLWSRMQALGTACTDTAKSSPDIGPYMNTWSTAHDLRHIAQLLQPDPSQKAKLQYWGFSYGTLLGITYASLFPDQVQRMVLDGVVDALAWYSGDLSTTFRDADRVVDSFFRYCSQVGYPRCAFADASARSSATDKDDTEAINHLRQRLTNLLADLKANPLWTSQPSPEIITYSDVKRLLKITLYAPNDLFPTLATILSDLEQRNASTMVAWKAMLREEMQPAHCLDSTCQSSATCREACQSVFRVELTSGIACLDWNQKLLNITHEAYSEHYLRPVMETSQWIGDSFADFAMPCVSWKGQGPGSFNGPIGAQNMSTPILFVSNSLDPVTPLHDAHAMSALFNRSVVLEQHAEGHCSYASRSACTERHIKKYFRTGEVPQEGTRCETEIRPFAAEQVSSRSFLMEEEKTEL
ncbi:hypothetical protein ASPBRDRAFT_185215 [Aspergillus brasiliensis CBS 101740]|uniref:Peptidase S33 tripeptidyl aminopeptidase-like C-terminal domain-containing protein n=1 Tax=Aspergillus brasiliensis (strain CBS 101740 / IMI 381727 / IBT 21946) TaxID=767769 RepID=A0A1L9U9D2_ASPBC|nr:hypothetical protein ASPBRDRAFT_185215 [Aspergillus brasiliensis CBS 101740]